MKLNELYSNFSIKYKILIFFYCIIFIISIMLGFYFYYTSEQFVINKVRTANVGIIKQIGNNIDFLQREFMNISTYICLDTSVQEVLYNTSKDSENKIDIESGNLNNSLKFLNTLIATNSYVSCIILYNNKGIPLFFMSTDSSAGAKNISAPQEQNILSQAQYMKGSPIWFTIDTDKPYFIEKNLYPKIALGRLVKNINNSSQIGFLVLCVNEQFLKNMYMDSLHSNKEGILILDKSNNIISQQNALFIRQNLKIPDGSQTRKLQTNNNDGYYIDKYQKESMLVTYSRVSSTNWKVFYSVPLYELTKEINSTKILTLLVILVCILITSPLIVFASTYLTSPIKKLHKSIMKFQEGNFDERVDFKYKDELGVLGQGYNTMVSNIKQLIDNNYILQIKEREAELNALQAQINPHFLYNTLETIYWESEEKGQSNISEMIINLSRLFRLSLNRGKSFTLISGEKELIQYYLNLQKMRLKDRLNFSMKFDERILDYFIPKLIIQPFVENAIVHGIEEKAAGGNLEVTGLLIEDKVQFIIKDNGIGMDELTIQSLFVDKDPNNINTSKNPGGYAIKNVIERLNLYFKDNYSLKFTSSLGDGTSVEITIPPIEHEENKEDAYQK